MHEATVVLLSYKRERNIESVVSSVKSQTACARIFIWHNSPSAIINKNVDLVVTASSNLYCWPRWFMASMADTEIVLSLDDDLAFSNQNTLAEILNTYQKHGRDNLVCGPEGVSLKPKKPYFPLYSGRINKAADDQSLDSSVHICAPGEDQAVDIVKGRCLAFARSALSAIPLKPEYGETCDDIALSSLVGGGGVKTNLVPACLTGGFVDLPGKNDEMALSSSPVWKQIREQARWHYFPSQEV
ncbi:hypothetical protein NE852_23550 [Rhizobium sp. Pop5]|uniref:putative glycosyltransferase n=1 Tax=Rhizobium sp. Pop5 TaxID=1223565 RepID=UPI000283730B|nr:putative glycosyltransferase [Rhizobium sp. Pop5]EJZ22148.1 putative glycosyltransferase [Rhizobium sp. Pop5]UVD56981.1 hypothetical protein NE852_23550 [Rhizobium sp. Pop5]